MAEFWQDLTDVPQEGALQTKGGMKISHTRQELEEYFSILLESRSLEQLAGETAYWVLIPSIVAVYSFPVMLWITKSVGWAALGSFGLMMSFSLLNQSAYHYLINKYLIRPASHALPKLLFIAGLSLLLYQSERNLYVALFPLLWYVFIDRVPILYLLSELMLVKTKAWLYKLPDPDGVLRQVGWYWARKYGLRQSDSGKILGRTRP